MTLEAVKVIQGYKMSSDNQMRVDRPNTNLTVQSSNLNEELGQIQFVFSDKIHLEFCCKVRFPFKNDLPMSFPGDASIVVSFRELSHSTEYNSIKLLIELPFSNSMLFPF